MKINLFVVLILSIINSAVFGGFEKEIIVKGLEIPWAIVELDQNNLLISERRGTLKKYNFINKSLENVKGAPKVYARGQGGLLDLTLHPNFKENKRVYISYSKNLGEGKTTALGYGFWDGQNIVNFKEVFVAKGSSNKRYHFGSRIVFTHENELFLSIGERGVRKNAQDLTNHLGSILKLNDEGKPAKGAPFIKNALPEIYSYGHRNPQGLYFDLDKHILYEIEHGPRGGDEINIVEAGKNYGWPIISYGKEYVLPMMVGEATSKPGMEQPVKYYVPSIAPSDLFLYKQAVYPELKGSLITGALGLTHLHAYNLNTKKELRLFKKENMRVRSLLSHSNGEIYFGTDDGIIYKLKNKEKTK